MSEEDKKYMNGMNHRGFNLRLELDSAMNKRVVGKVRVEACSGRMSELAILLNGLWISLVDDLYPSPMGEL